MKKSTLCSLAACLMLLLGFTSPALCQAENRIGADYLWYGINQYTNESYVPVLAEYKNDLKFKFLRVDVMWHLIEPQRDVFNWTKTDAIVNALPLDTEILFTLYSSARWAIDGTAIDGAEMEMRATYVSAPPKVMQDYYLFVSALVNRYKGRVKYYQIENEVYDTTNLFWRGTKEEYLALLTTASSAIRQADPSAKVLPSSLALAAVDVTLPVTDPKFQAALDFLSYTIGNGCNLFDIADIHLYYTLASIPERLSWFKDFLSGKNCAKPIWATETGGLDPRAYTNTWDDWLQAEDLAKRFTLAFGNGAEKVSWLNIHRTGDNDGSVWGSIRLTNDAYAKERRPSYYTYKILVKKIDRFTKVEAIPNGYKFTVNGKPVLVLWSDSQKSADVSAYISKPTVKVKHIVTEMLDGKPLYPPDEMVPVYAVPISNTPVFVEEG